MKITGKYHKEIDFIEDNDKIRHKNEKRNAQNYKWTSRVWQRDTRTWYVPEKRTSIFMVVFIPHQRGDNKALLIRKRQWSLILICFLRFLSKRSISITKFQKKTWITGQKRRVFIMLWGFIMYHIVPISWGNECTPACNETSVVTWHNRRLRFTFLTSKGY